MNLFVLRQVIQGSLRKTRLLFGALVCIGILSGCATVVNDSSQPIRVETLSASGEAIRGAECKLSNDHGVATTRSGETARIHRSGIDLQIDCSLAGQPAATGRAVSRANAGLAGNIILGGAIGAIIDHNKGTAYTYPSWLQLVFGETRVFDRRFEVDGQPLRGTRINEPNAPTYAFIDDLSHLPHSSDKMVERYQFFLSRPLPRAFAISEAGDWRMAWGNNPADQTLPSDPAERAAYACEHETGKRCFLYAIDDRVVYQPPKPVSPPSSTRLNQSGNSGVGESDGMAHDHIPEPDETTSRSFASNQGNAGTHQANSQVHVPFVSKTGQRKYLEYLDKPLPRAFAISDNGHFSYAWGTNFRVHPFDPKDRALARCAEFAGKECTLFSVDNEIVYKQ